VQCLAYSDQVETLTRKRCLLGSTQRVVYVVALKCIVELFLADVGGVNFLEVPGKIRCHLAVTARTVPSQVPAFSVRQDKIIQRYWVRWPESCVARSVF
jgi:hypothetical protein